MFDEMLNRRLELKELLVDERIFDVGSVVVGIGEALCRLLIEPVVSGIDHEAEPTVNQNPVAYRRSVPPARPCLLHLLFGISVMVGPARRVTRRNGYPTLSSKT